MTDQIDKEIEAIKRVLSALEPLRPEVRTSVLRYVTGRLQMPQQPVQASEQAVPAGSATGLGESAIGQKSSQTHIKEFKEQKKPRYAIEMAAVVAYYLQDLAPPKERKDRISTRDVETYFKIAEFKLPTKSQFTLPNARAAGYFDAVGNGEYKLNAVGHNLVAHSLPRNKDDNIARARKPKEKSAPAQKRK